MGEPRSPDCNDCEQFAWDETQVFFQHLCKQHCCLCHGGHAMQFTTTTYLTHWLTSYSFELCPLQCFRKRYARRMAKKEAANIFRCYLPNLQQFWIVKLPFVTLWPVTILQETSRLLSRRFLQDFAIYNRTHF